MPIKKPSSRLAQDLPLKAVRQRVGGHGRKGVYADLNLTSMIDFLVIVVVFLLGTFSATGELISIQRDLELPEATQTFELERAPIIAISRSTVTLDGRFIADVEALLSEEASEGLRIPKMVEELDVLRRNWQVVHPNDPFKGTIVLQSDKEADFKVIKRCMLSAGEAGYTNLNLAVKIGAKQ